MDRTNHAFTERNHIRSTLNRSLIFCCARGEDAQDELEVRVLVDGSVGGEQQPHAVAMALEAC